MRSSSGWSTSSPRTGHGWNVIVPICAAQPTTAISRRADLVRVPARRELDPRGLDVVRRALRDPLLEERVAAALLPGRQDDARVDALRPALERRRPPRERAHDPVADREVVADDVELGHRGRALGRREDHAVGVGHAQLAPAGVDGRALVAAMPEFYASTADPGRDGRGRASWQPSGTLRTRQLVGFSPRFWGFDGGGTDEASYAAAALAVAGTRVGVAGLAAAAAVAVAGAGPADLTYTPKTEAQMTNIDVARA